MSRLNHMTATTIVRLMRAHGKTIKQCADYLGVPQARVRYVRAHGVSGVGYVMDWMQAITGNPHAGWETVAKVYQ